MSNRLKPESRIKSQLLWEGVFEAGQSLRAFPLRLRYLKQSDFEGVKMGVAVPKRTIRKAVDRNHIKRLIREAYRRNKDSHFNNLKGGFALVFLYLGKEGPTYKEIEVAIQALGQKLNEYAKDDPTP